MIPKTIHYCWFGHGEMSPLMKECVTSWKKYCKDWEIKEWNEDDIDFAAMPLYVRQAYEAKKWGFVPDYIRLWIIYHYGGIYLDTDVEIIRPLDDLLTLKAFAGFEDEKNVNFGQGFGAEQGNSVLKKLMDSYETMRFVNEDGSLNLVPSPQLNTEVLKKIGLKCDGSKQMLDGMTILPKEYLCPISFPTMKKRCTKNTYSIHHFAASWLTEEEKKRAKRNYITHFPHRVLRKVLGESRYERLKRILKRG